MSETKRKLAAIVFTDIVGFTKLTSINQSAASELLVKQRKLFQPIVEDFDGTWLKEMGDGLLLLFNTVTDAVKCSIKLQEICKDIENLNLRIGIHQGEVLLTKDDVIGDDVNIAARVEPFSAPGGIAISNKVNDALVRESEFETKYIGKPKLKGVGQEVKIFCIISNGLPETKLSEVSAKLENENKRIYIYVGIILSILVGSYFAFFTKSNSVESIAILNMTVDNTSGENLDYMETISEDIIFDLSTSSNGLINVLEYSELKKYKNSDLSLDELSKKIDADYVFQSSIKADKDKYQLRCRLFDSNIKKDVFSNKWYFETKNLQSISGVLVENIIKELNIDAQDGFNKITYDPEAYELYLKSKSLFESSNNDEDDIESIQQMKDAIAKDDNLVMAMLYLGQILLERGDNDKASVYFERSLSKSKTLQNNAGIAESLRKQGMLLRKNRDYSGALNKFGESLAMSTIMNDKKSMAKILNSMAILNYREKDFDNALKNWLHALALAEEFDDKLKMSKYTNNIGIWYYKDEDFTKAIEYYNKSLNIKNELKDVRNIGKTLNNIGEVYFSMGDYNNSINKFNESIEIKTQLGDVKGRISSLINRGKSHFYDQNYNDAINDFRMTTNLTDYENQIQKSNRFIGMSHFYLSNFDSAELYLEECYEYFFDDEKYKISILPYLSLVSSKKNNSKNARKYINKFKNIIVSEDPYIEETIIVNWSAYEALKHLGDIDQANEFLENAYMQMKYASKNIKSKNDRNKFLDTKMHKKIIVEYKNN